MNETTGMQQLHAKFNLGNLPPEGHEFVGKFFWRLFLEAKKDKVDRLGMHDRWLNQHADFRGKRKRRATYPQVSVNSYFKTAYSTCAALTEKTPKAEVEAEGDAQSAMAVLSRRMDKWWDDTEQQNSLWLSVFTQQLYGITAEKAHLNVKTDASGNVVKSEPQVIMRDVFGIFPAPGYHKCCDVEGLPYICDAELMPVWQVRKMFNIPDSVPLTADAEDMLGSERETMHGGKKRSGGGTRHIGSEYADIGGAADSAGMSDKVLVVEIWVRDDSYTEEQIPGQVPVTYDDGTEATDDFGRPMMQEGIVGTQRVPNYPDGIRCVTVCSNGKYVLRDVPNPNINWELIRIRADQLTQATQQVPMTDATGQPMIDPMTQQPKMQEVPLVGSPEEAMQLSMDIAKETWLWGRFPYSIIPALVDPAQWWPFSILEVFEGMHGKIEAILTKLVAYYERCLFPILINPQGSGVDANELSNGIGLAVRPTLTHANLMRYLDPPSLPPGLMDTIQALMMMEDIVSMTPEVTEGRRPVGITAPTAIIALAEKAAAMFIPQARQVDQLVRNRGRIIISLMQQWGTEAEPVQMDDGTSVPLTGINLAGAIEYKVESGSSAPITKAGRRQQYVELFKLGALDIESLLEGLEIPRAAEIVERITEQKTLPGALDTLVQAGLPQEMAVQLYQMLMQNQQGMGRKKNRPGAQGQQPGTATQSPEGLLARQGQGNLTAPPEGASPAVMNAYGQM